jgi:hypothetical protein
MQIAIFILNALTLINLIVIVVITILQKSNR